MILKLYKLIYLMDNIKLIGGTSNPELSKKIAFNLNQQLMDVSISYFANNEIRINLNEQVRNYHVFIIQTGDNNRFNKSINDVIMETYLLIKTCKRSDAKTINLIMPHFPYARQDKKDGRSAISARDMADLFETAGLNRIICFDLHAPQIQGFFNIPCDNLFCLNLMKEYLYEKYFDDNYQDKFVLIAPDLGASALIREASNKLKLPFLLCNKTRDYNKNNVVEEVQVIGDRHKYLTGRTALIIDDLCDTAGTIQSVIDALKERDAKEVIVIISHGLLNGKAIERINENNNLKKIICSNSVCQEEHLKLCNKLEVFDISNLCSSVVKCLINGDSISELFK